MAALFMDLLIVLTCRCLILSNNMLLACAWVLKELLLYPVYVWKQMSPPPLFQVEKNFTPILPKIKL